MDLKSKLSAKLRILRIQKGFSQEYMANQLGLSTNGYANIERGVTDVSISRIEAIAQVFNMTSSELLNLGDTVYHINVNNGQGILNNSGSINSSDPEVLIKSLSTIANFMQNLDFRLKNIENQ